VSFLSSTQVQMTINVSTTADKWTVKVTNPDGQGICSVLQASTIYFKMDFPRYQPLTQQPL
jgi:hypothetical protein